MFSNKMSLKINFVKMQPQPNTSFKKTQCTDIKCLNLITSYYYHIPEYKYRHGTRSLKECLSLSRYVTICKKEKSGFFGIQMVILIILKF